jgi:hypothetical protein
MNEVSATVNTLNLRLRYRVLSERVARLVTYRETLLPPNSLCHKSPFIDFSGDRLDL